MEENKDLQQQSESGNVESTTENYIAAIKELKQKTVDKSEYERVLAENKELINSIINSTSIPNESEPVKEEVDLKTLRKELYKKDNDLSNLEYWEKTLELRNAVIEQGGIDPFVPQGSHITATKDDYAAAEEVAEGIQHCIDVADGDSAIFTRELQRIMVDTMPYKRR